MSSRAFDPERDPRWWTDFVYVTPSMASEWLTKNVLNREIYRKHVNDLKASAERDEFDLNGDTIKFDWDDHLLDGQHRLMMIAEGGFSVWTVVVRGLDPMSREKMDIGRVLRALKDNLVMRGIGKGDAKSLAATINVLWKIDNNRMRGGDLPSVAQGLKIYEKHDGLIESSRAGKRMWRAFRGSDAVYGACHYCFAQLDADGAEDFFEQLIDGTDLSMTDPVWHLRRLMPKRLDRTVRCAYFIKAWNAWITGQEMSRLQWRPFGKNPEPFPQIVGPIQ